MRKLGPYFAVGLAVALLIAWQVNIARLFQTFQPIIVCLSIMAAAIFVRLNRGMPSLEWKSLTTQQRKQVTSAVLKLSKDYVIGLIVTATNIIIIIILTAIGKYDALKFEKYYQLGIVFIFSISLILSIIWMGYVIWRDYDIVRLQKRIIDDASDREESESQSVEASKKTAAMKSSMVNVDSATIRPW